MSIASKIIPHSTYDDWVHWEGRWELMEGHPIAMSPAPVPHQRAAAELRTELAPASGKSGCKQCRAYDPLDYKISEDTTLVPGILLICGEAKKKYFDFAPALRDRNTKDQLYEQQGVRYYLVADTDKKTIEVYELAEGKYHLRTDNLYQFRFNDAFSISPDFTNIFN